MNFIMSKKQVCFLVLFVAVAASCKSKREIAASMPAAVKETITDNIVKTDPAVSALLKAELPVQTANISKMSVVVNYKGREFTSSASCRFVRDSVLFLSVQPLLGIEVFRAEFYPDSILIFDKMNGNYYDVDYKLFSDKFGVNVDFNSIQSLLSNRFFCIGKSSIDPAGYQVTSSAADLTNISYLNGNMQQNTFVSVDKKIVQVLIKALDKDYTLQTDYSDFTSFADSVVFPKNINLAASNRSEQTSGRFTVVKAEFNKPVRISKLNTGDYTKANIERFFKK